MGEREALLRAVCQHPDDNTPRFVFADWLDEHDEPERAEFIRVQIELSSHPESDKRHLLQAREAELLSDHSEEWVQPLVEYWLDWSDKPYAFCRGFVEELELEAATFIDRGEELFAMTPLRGVRLPDEEWYEVLAACPLLLRLKSLDLTGSGLTSGFRGIHDFLASPNLGRIEHLILQGMDDNAHLDPTGVDTLAKNPHLLHLRHLDLSNNWFGPEGIPPLIEAIWLPQLERLELEGVGIADEGVDWLAGATRFTNLQILNLVANSIGDRGGRRILQTDWLDQLAMLDLRDHYGYRERHIDEGLRDETIALLKLRFGPRIRF
jgi:uncharacterized protein (TIGR02996 family)